MLTLQRASAGSGKTYSLTRSYLKFLLGKKTGNTYKLKDMRELAGAHSRLLAITFTNKATAEMRKRFIDKLSALASDITSPAKDIDYLEDFMQLFGAGRDEIQRTAAAALSEILNHYSDFNVSTIDSFFQQILHSFAYEAELPDDFNVELDTSVIISLALENLFAEAHNKPDSEARYWLDIYMAERQRMGSKWNVSQRTANSAYGDLLTYLRMIDNEKFRQKREDLEKFFSNNTDMRALYEKTEKLAKGYILQCYEDAVRHTEQMQSLCEHYGVAGQMNANLKKRLDKVRNATADACGIFKKLDPLQKLINKKGIEQLKNDAGIIDLISQQESEWIGSVLRWQASRGYVRMIMDAVPVLALTMQLLKHMKDYRTANNVVQLSDTNTILRAITGDTDVPFIYEKIGTEIDSYMIDEFQDTSELQWVNMQPLVDNSLANGNDNLIIGDAKQSIYRFRNADSSLITTKVPASFSHAQLEIKGTTPSENANRRSADAIVRFNNSLFRWLASDIVEENGCNRIAGTYRGLLQEPYNASVAGYVRITVQGKQKNKETEKNDKPDDKLDYLGPLISDMLERGYRQRDIAILVRSNDVSEMAVNALVRYNSANAGNPGFRPLEFICDEALRISRAASVEIVIAVLRSLTGNRAKEAGDFAKKENNPDRKYSRYTTDLCSILHRLQAGHPEEDTGQLLNRYFNGEDPGVGLDEMLHNMPAMALPAIIESIIAIYVPEKLRSGEALFLSAFQDAVAAYCERFSPDVASFLTWWDTECKKLYVNSPEGADAVSVLTIHKAKGLEWRCVIVPDGQFSLAMNRNENAWLPAKGDFAESLPRILPVHLNGREKFMNTPWQEDYMQILGDSQLDSLNLAYVAFTRAVNELYLFLPGSKTDSIGKRIIALVEEDASDKLIAQQQEAYLFIRPERLTITHCDDGSSILAYDTLPDRATVVARNKEIEEEKNKNRPPEVKEKLKSYTPAVNLPVLRCEREKTLDLDSESPSAAALQGTMKHEIMESLMPGCDLAASLHRELRRRRVNGLISADQENALFNQLSPAFENERVKEWFAPGIKAYTERPIVESGKRDHIPDRIVVTPGGVATVIDYKFGKEEKVHRKQVKDYMALLRETALFNEVRGAVWYVAENKIVDC